VTGRRSDSVGSFWTELVAKAKSGRLTSKGYVDLFDRVSKVLN
jgi:hypothetical protein